MSTDEPRKSLLEWAGIELDTVDMMTIRDALQGCGRELKMRVAHTVTEWRAAVERREAAEDLLRRYASEEEEAHEAMVTALERVKEEK